jgi:hypothetical protein
MTRIYCLIQKISQKIFKKEKKGGISIAEIICEKMIKKKYF